MIEGTVIIETMTGIGTGIGTGLGTVIEIVTDAMIVVMIGIELEKVWTLAIEIETLGTAEGRL